MVEAFAEGAKEGGHIVTIVNVCRKKIAGCLACEYCHTKGNGECIQKDDMQEVSSPGVFEANMQDTSSKQVQNVKQQKKGLQHHGIIHHYRRNIFCRYGSRSGYRLCRNECGGCDQPDADYFFRHRSVYGRRNRAFLRCAGKRGFCVYVWKT